MARIDNYKLADTLGVGTVGTVYRAKDRSTGRWVALKVLLPQVSEDQNIARRFEREMSILRRLDHPHIVRHYGDGRHKGRLYYVMELVDDGSLKEELAIYGRLPWPRACTYGCQIASALQHAHNHGIVHRHLKPANLFLSEDGTLKLGDFGIALDTGAVDLTDAGLTVGTYAYMAPEQIRADCQVTDQTDLYGLGCLLFEMLTGHPPYVGTNFAQIFEQHLHREPPQVRDEVPDCPPELDVLISQLLAKSPDDRPFNARYVQGNLQALLDELGPGAPIGRLPIARAGLDSPSTRSVAANVSWMTLIAILMGIASLVGAVAWIVRHGA